MKKIYCRLCGHDEYEYLGVDDGGGDYGSSICDQFHCLNCNNYFEDNCIDVFDLENDPGLEDENTTEET